MNAPESIEKHEPEVSGGSPAAHDPAETPDVTPAATPEETLAETSVTDGPTAAGAAETDAAGTGAAETDAAETGPSGAAAPEASGQSTDTSIYVRRGRVPTLGFWIALAIAVPVVIALISSPFFGFADLGGVVNFVLLVAVFVGLPLAAIVAAIDAIRQRPSTKRGR